MLINFYDFHHLCSRENDYSHRESNAFTCKHFGQCEHKLLFEEFIDIAKYLIENGAEKNEIFEEDTLGHSQQWWVFDSHRKFEKTLSLNTFFLEKKTKEHSIDVNGKTIFQDLKLHGLSSLSPYRYLVTKYVW